MRAKPAHRFDASLAVFIVSEGQDGDAVEPAPLAVGQAVGVEAVSGASNGGDLRQNQPKLAAPVNRGENRLLFGTTVCAFCF
jgi:hypothetical protein